MFAPAAGATPQTAAQGGQAQYPPTMFAPAAGQAVASAAQPASVAATPSAAAIPPVLASQSIAAETFPVEPGKGLLRWLLIIGGLALIAAFCAPRAISSGAMVFSWNLLSGVKGVALVNELYLAGGGVLMILAGALPLPYLARGIAALVLGLVPLGMMLANLDWRQGATLGAILLLSASLVHRYHYRGSILARVLVAVGVLTVLATLLVPAAGSVPLIAVFELFGGGQGAALIVLGTLPLVLLLLSLLSLLAFLGRGSTGLGHIWATAWICYLPLTLWLAASFALVAGGRTLTGYSQGLALLAYLTAAALGLAHILSRLAKTPAHPAA